MLDLNRYSFSIHLVAYFYDRYIVKTNTISVLNRNVVQRKVIGVLKE